MKAAGEMSLLRSVLRHCCLDDKKGIQLVKPVPLIPKCSLLEQLAEEKRGELRNTGSSGKWLFKWKQCIH